MFSTSLSNFISISNFNFILFSTSISNIITLKVYPLLYKHNNSTVLITVKPTLRAETFAGRNFAFFAFLALFRESLCLWKFQNSKTRKVFHAKS